MDRIPKLLLRVAREPSAPDGTLRCRWHVTMKAPDSVGGRNLGYRASGTLVEQGDRIEISYHMEPQVHDELRPVWTSMNPTDRFDIRKQFERLVRGGVAELKKSGEDVFERKID